MIEIVKDHIDFGINLKKAEIISRSFNQIIFGSNEYKLSIYTLKCLSVCDFLRRFAINWTEKSQIMFRGAQIN